jgi:cytidyltransferase-like protein
MFRASIVSGYFGPLHTGHLDMMEEACSRNGRLIVIVNSDVQQELKKGRVIQPAVDRLRVVRALRTVDTALIAIDTDNSVARTLAWVRAMHPDHVLEFCQGGDRRTANDLPEQEAEAARKHRIAVVYGVGGTEKADSSTRLIEAAGL